MKISQRYLNLFLMIGLSAAVSQGCASTKPAMPASGFLSDYSDFKSVGDGFFVKQYEAGDISRYSKLLIAPPKIYFDAESKKITEEMLQQMRDDLYQSLQAELGKTYEIVDAPGENTLLVRTAITDVRANKVYLNLHWSTTLSGLGVGGATIEAEFIDSLTNKHLLSVVSTKKGNRVKYFNGLTKWGHTAGVVKGWAQFLVDALNDSGDMSAQEALDGVEESSE